MYKSFLSTQDRGRDTTPIFVLWAIFSSSRTCANAISDRSWIKWDNVHFSVHFYRMVLSQQSCICFIYSTYTFRCDRYIPKVFQLQSCTSILLVVQVHVYSTSDHILYALCTVFNLIHNLFFETAFHNIQLQVVLFKGCGK